MSLSNIKNIIAVGSGKGGVGKSTVSTNLACALKVLDYKVGILDADIMGASIPGMFGMTGASPETKDGLLIPLEQHGIKIMSAGMLITQEQPVVMRGAMVTKTLNTFIKQVAWGDLDYLIIDLPPGTGDIQISLCQAIPLSGAVIVTTPQDVSLGIALKGLRMFELVSVPILGIIENMSSFTCPACTHETHLFGTGGGERLATKTNTPFLGSIPLEHDISLSGDSGSPIVLSNPNCASTKSYLEIAGKVINTKMQPNISIQSISQKDRRTISILWDDGSASDFDTTSLRLACTCAICKNRDEAPQISNVTVVSISPVGNYAIRITWSDGHNTGIYSFKYLKELHSGNV